MFLFSSQDGTKLALKNVTPGNSVFSMLGILDVLTVCYGINVCHSTRERIG